MTMLIVDPRQIRELADADSRLLEIASQLVDTVPSIFGHLWTTRLWSSSKEERKIEREIEERTGKPYKTSGIHQSIEPIRAWDIAPAIKIDDKEGRAIADAVNADWIYDYARPKLKCVIYHMKHWHIQVHPNTRRNRV